MRVLGVDPGSHATGYGLVEREGGSIRHLAHGVLRPPPGQPVGDRLSFLYRELHAIARATAPDVAVVERVFLAANPRSALVLGEARGALLAGLGAAGLRVAELAARQVKKAVTGSGDADKQQMQTMVVRLLALETVPAADAADALALALAYAQAGPLAELGLRTGRSRGRVRRRAASFVLGRSR